MERAFDFLGRNKWLTEIGAVITGFWVAGAADPLLGMALVALGVLSIAISRFGTQWDVLSGGQKVLVVPGLVVGYIGLSALIVLVVIFFTVLRDEMNRS